MELFNYKCCPDTDVYRQLNALYKRLERCNKECDSLASSLGAQSYLTDSEQDFGGIVAFAFSPSQHIDRSVWEPYCDNETKESTSVEKYYVPSASFRHEIMKAQDAESLMNDKTIIVSQLELSFSDVSYYFSREDSAKMAGVTLTTPSIEALGSQLKLNRANINALSMGVPLEVLPVRQSIPDDKKELISMAQQQDRLIHGNLSDIRFRNVLKLSGNVKAVEILRRMMMLEVVPAGTINQIVGCKSDKYRCGITKDAEGIKIVSPTPLDDNPNFILL